jgi:hypothetical protein
VKKKLLILSGVVAVLLVGGLVVMRLKKVPSGIISPLVETEKEELSLIVWEDPAGFKFSYPSKITIDPHEEDKENYAHLELTSPSHPGKILIWMKDTNYKNPDDWAKKEVGEGQVFDSELGGKPAKKVASINPKKLTTATIDVDVLVLVEVFPEDEWWNEVYNQILSSFEFIPLAGEPASAGASAGKEKAAPGPWEGSGGGAGVIEEEEEVVE